MAESVKMPALGESVTEGTVTRWLKEVGESIEVDEPLLEVSTDKVDTEVPSPVAGVVEKILVEEDETVEVGAELAVIGDGSGSAGDDAAPASTSASEAEPTPEAPAAEPTPEASAAPAAPASGEVSGTEVTLPALGESVTEGTVTRWLKEVGESIEVDEPLLEVSTDKVDTEVPSPVAGTVLAIKVAEDETAEVGSVLAIIGDPSAAPAESSPEAPEKESPKQEAPKQEAPEQEAPKAEAKPASGDVSGTEVTLPALGESVTEGTVTRWLKEVGESIEVDEPLLEVSTDKVDTEVPSPVAGTVLAIKVAEDETAEVGSVLAIIGDPSAAPAESSPEAPEKESPKQEAPKQESPKQEAPKQEAPKQEAPKQEAPKQEAPAGDDSAVYVTPLVRKLAAQHGVDLTTVSGSGVGGRIRKQDVIAAAEAAKKASEAPAPAASSTASAAPAAPAAAPSTKMPVSELRGTSEKMSRLRKIIAQRMPESLHTMAQLTTVVEVDVTKVAALRAKSKNVFAEKTGQKLTYLPFFAKAAIEALQAYPKINARIEDDTIVYPGGENLAIAVDTPRGLLTPVIKDAGEMTIADLAGGINDLAARTRDNKVGPDELSGGTFTLTNTGSAGALFDTPIVPAPTVAILGVGTIVKRPVVISGPEGDSIAIRSMVYLAISYDHRLVDGADAGRYLSLVKRRLEEGAFEGDLGI
ncbi:2-oxoglutarate dehydrogenase, E2 component, dihydrolipoamide succinyltransferase [Serinibacter salmoneus]|uniref:Dihydrolipoamide acetyltransferase component of pyruvate dehydrogenase complex n=1 Tax=Serinibacter salmoneus TaxID=556530 RepID=A0A2A9D0L8_9MICO|nr:2-oxoglutarate dehydrogenase, E2 component, dihydrolipoamide succinyltransferase [Serinibacter salmoneus]PFG19492.1 2-oxoglutarate dehydrogenase E2 component [Serinibacter salmoneus]